MSVQKTTQPVARNSTALPTLPKGIQLERAPAPLPLAGLPKSINVQRTTTATTKSNTESATPSTWVPPRLPSGISVTHPAAAQASAPNLPKSITISKGPPRAGSASSSEGSSPVSGSANSGYFFWKRKIRRMIESNVKVPWMIFSYFNYSL